MRLAVVVPATDSPPTLNRCLGAIRAAREPPDELVVVDEPAGAGPALARNVGVARSTAEIVAFVDSDVLVAPDVFVRIRRRFAEDPTLGAVFGAYDDELGASGLVARFRNLLHHHVHARAPGPATTFWAGIGAIRRESVVNAGGFDAARYARPSIEDVELGMRLAAAGERILLDPQITGTHLKAWTLTQMLRTDFAARGVPWVELLLERRHLPTDLNLGWRERASAVLSLSTPVVVARGKLRGTAGCLIAFVALNRPFYGLLSRRLGVARAALCVPLHMAHHLAGAAALLVGPVSYAIRRRRQTPGERPIP